MALIKCFKCGGSLSDKADFCPHCGFSKIEINQSSFQKADLHVPTNCDPKFVCKLSDFEIDNMGCLVEYQGRTDQAIAIPNGVTSIGKGAFEGHPWLVSIFIPNTVKHIDDMAFQDCKKLTSINIPDSVYRIGRFAFQNCQQLTTVTIGTGMKFVEQGAFINCKSLVNINLPNSVISFGCEVFMGTAYYSDSQNWDDGVLYIGNHLIKADSYSVSGIYKIKEGTKSLAYGSFSFCEELTNIDIPNSVKRIGLYSFNNCSSLTSIAIPNGVTMIEEGVFDGCSSLQFFNVPESVACINERNFIGCDNLKTVYFQSEQQKNKFAHCFENNMHLLIEKL